MVQVIHFKDLIDIYDHFLLDAYGVFWGSAAVGLLPGARETMEFLVSKGKKVGILSNSTQLAAKEKEKLSKYGLKEGVHYQFLLTSGEVTRELLIMEKLPFSTPKKKYWLLGSDHPRFSPHSVLFEETGYSQTEILEDADFIYIMIPHLEGIDQESPEAFLQAIRNAASKGIPVLCSNPDHFAHEGSPPRLVVRQGMIAHLLQDQGAVVHYIGKPFGAVYEKALKQFPTGVQPREILMVGDTPETDIRGASQAGLATALVTETGLMKERIKENSVSFAIGQLPATDQPDHIIKGLNLYDF